MNTHDATPDLTDDIEIIGSSTVQHGQLNKRAYLMKLSFEDSSRIIEILDALAIQNRYSKVVVKVPRYALEVFTNNEYHQEAHVPGFFNGDEDGYFLSRYYDPARGIENEEEVKKYDEVLEAARQRAQESPPPLPGEEWTARLCTPDEADQVARVYGEVFPTYPFPIMDPTYIRRTMDSHVRYFGVWHDDTLVSLASAEMDTDAENVEMTDFATLPDYRRKGLASFLLDYMERDQVTQGNKTAYTIARAGSFGMNLTFAKLGYKYAGRLKNNTNISGGFESMTIWYKTLIEQSDDSQEDQDTP